MSRRPVEFEAFPAELAVAFGPYRAVVRYVVDGDTFDCLVDQGWNDYPYKTVRLAGIDAPEKNRAETREAGLAAQAYLASLIPVGTPVKLVTQKDSDSFGRYVAVVILLSGAELVSVNERMVAAGHAVWKEY